MGVVPLDVHTLFLSVLLYKCVFYPLHGFRTRYFSSPRKGHNPLQGRAYYQLLECLGVSLSYILIHICANKVVLSPV